MTARIHTATQAGKVLGLERRDDARFDEQPLGALLLRQPELVARRLQPFAYRTLSHPQPPLPPASSVLVCSLPGNSTCRRRASFSALTLSFRSRAERQPRYSSSGVGMFAATYLEIRS